MRRFMFTITDPEGFHARPAGLFVKEVKKFPCAVTVERDATSADARKMFGLMGLGIKGGDTIAVTTEGEQEREAAAALEAFLQKTL